MTRTTASIDRRSAVGILGAIGATAIAGGAGTAGAQDVARAGGSAAVLTPELLGWDEKTGQYVLPSLPYPNDALEPHIDAETMDIHRTKHHQAYVTGLNKALAELARARESGDFALVKHWSRELAFHGGGHVNHCLFWRMMAPPAQGGGGEPSGDLAAAIARDFGSFEKFSAHFQAAAGAVEGSGWAWLVHDRASGRLLIQQMEKQQNMLLTGCTPLLGIDVWEHAYYIKYRNRRAEYVKAFMNVANWGFAAELYGSHMS